MTDKEQKTQKQYGRADIHNESIGMNLDVDVAMKFNQLRSEMNFLTTMIMTIGDGGRAKAK